MFLQLSGGLLLAASLVAVVPVLVLFVQISAARRSSSITPAADDGRPRLAVLMPAHDESAAIGDSLRALLPQLEPSDRILVVADNCTDDTAAIAKACGAQVTERQDPVRRGKGYALDHGIRQLALDPPQVVVVVDADCLMAEGSLDLLARECARFARPVQALYLMQAGQGAAQGMRIAQLAWVVRNEVRLLGMTRLGMPCQLMGTGMAFPWPLIAGASLASGSLVEDMQLGLDLVGAGTPPRFCHGARVTSRFPESSEGAIAQRTRWDHGHLAMIGTQGLPLLWRGLRRGNSEMVAIALDLCVPPVATLVFLLAGLATLGAALLLAGGSMAPLLIALLAIALMTVSLGSAWWRFARHVVSIRQMAAIPAYLLARLPIYLRLFTARQTEWIRTRRDHTPK